MYTGFCWIEIQYLIPEGWSAHSTIKSNELKQLCKFAIFDDSEPALCHVVGSLFYCFFLVKTEFSDSFLFMGWSKQRS